MRALEIIQKKNVFKHQREVFEAYRGKKVWITGIRGSIGWSLAKRLLENGTEVGGIDCNEAEVAKILAHRKSLWGRVVAGMYTDILPVEYDYIFHCAAFKHVRLAPANTLGYQSNNTTGVAHFVERLHASGSQAKFILCSTDKAAGESVMGKTKKEAEDEVVFRGYHALRLVNVAYSRGSVLQLWRREKLHRVCRGDVSRYWMQMEDAVYALLLTGLQKPGKYTVHNVPKLTMEEMKNGWDKEFGPKRWMEFEMVHEAGDEKLCKDNEFMTHVTDEIARIEHA
jgi:FlaA1/EpsC-like NDP-sugar epimerase